MFIETDGSSPQLGLEESKVHAPPRSAPTLEFLGRGADQRTALNSVAAVLADSLAQQDQLPQPSTKTPASAKELSAAINRVDLNCPIGDLDATLDELRPLWLDHAIRYDSPIYLAHLNCPITAESFAGDVLATAMNTAVESWDQASSAALIEDRLIRWAAEQAGMNPQRANGTFTSGGTQSNHQALYTAREKALSKNPEATIGDLVVYCSELSHYSIARSAHILGLSTSNVITIPTDPQGRMDPAALQQAIAELPEHLVTMAIVATGGTTDLGAIDPISRIASISHQAHSHLHVDCAYGGALLLSPTRRHLLDGIEHADSFTLDFHKSFFQPLACSALIYRNEADLAHITWHAEYLNADSDPRLNLADRSMQTTRRFDALKLWVSLRTHGPAAIGKAFDNCCDLAQQGAQLIANQADFELLAQPQLSTLMFRFTPEDTDQEAIDQITPLIRARLFDQGDAIIAGTIQQDRPYLKFTLLNPTLGVEDLRRAIQMIRDTGRTLLEQE